MKKIIGISGNARSGKDTVGRYIKDILEKKGYTAEVVSFAAKLREEVDDFCLAKLGISAFTTDDAKKKLIRPFLVCWGTEIRRNIDESYWIAELDRSMTDENVIYIVTDLRFENEYQWIKDNGGITVYLERSSIAPANEYESLNNAILKKRVDCVWKMPTTRDMTVLKKCIEKLYLHSFKNFV
jgi:hypothetical protein